MPQILEQHFHERQPPAFANYFFGLFQAAKFYKGSAAGFGCGHASLHVFFDVKLEMAFHLGGEF